LGEAGQGAHSLVSFVSAAPDTGNEYPQPDQRVIGRGLAAQVVGLLGPDGFRTPDRVHGCTDIESNLFISARN
jgi:hypothetical protein